MSGARMCNGLVAEPTATRDANGYVTLDWPQDDPPVALVNRALMAEMVDQINELVTLRKAVRP